jgi:hypothetical protein
MIYDMKTRHYPACRDCAHYGRGYATRTRQYKQPVCLNKPKNIGGVGGYFYTATPSDKACDMYQPRHNNN